MINTNRTWNPRDEQTIMDAIRLYNNLLESFGPFYKEQNTLYDFTISALQWDKKIREYKRRMGGVANSYNLTRTIFNVIFGIDRDNRKKGKATPRTGGDAELATVVSQSLDYFLYHSGFYSNTKRTFIDQVIGRLGIHHFGWRYNGSKDKDGMLFHEATDPREMAWEPFFNDPLWEKSGFLFRNVELSVEDILDNYAFGDQELIALIQQESRIFFETDPQRGKWISRKLKQFFSAVYETTFSGSSSNSIPNFMNWWNPMTGKFNVLEVHEKRMEKNLMVTDHKNNRVVNITEPYEQEYRTQNNRSFDGYDYQNEIIDNIKERYGLQGGSVDTELENRRFMTALVPAFMLKVNEQVYPIESRYYTYIPQGCYDTHVDPLKMQSVMDDLLDPQMDFNKARSLILELLAKYSNKGWIVDENAISGFEEDWTTSRMAPYRRVRTGYIQMIKPEEGQTISPELIRMPIETMSLMKAISNASDEVRGNNSPGVTSGKHFIAQEQRQAKSYTYIFENRDGSHKACYELALCFVRAYVKTQRIIRITTDIDPRLSEDKNITLNQQVAIPNEEGSLQWKVINDINSYEYDIEIGDAPYSASAQEEKTLKLTNVFNAAAEVNPKKADAMLPIMVKNLGGEEADQILKAWKDSEQPSPEQQQLQQLMTGIQMILAKLGVEQTKADLEGTQLDNMKKAEEVKQIKSGKNVFGLLAQHTNGSNGNQ